MFNIEQKKYIHNLIKDTMTTKFKIENILSKKKKDCCTTAIKETSFYS